MKIVFFKNHIAAAGILIILCAAIFANTLQNDLIWDDSYLVFHNPYIQDIRNIPLFFTPHYWNHLHPFSGRKEYKPVRTATLAIDYFFWQKNPLGCHLTNLLLHTVNVLLSYVVLVFLARRAGRENPLSTGSEGPFFSLPFFAALLFAAHPVHTESITFVMNRGELLAFLFFALSFFCFALTVEAPAGRRHWGVSTIALLCFALALMSKEMALTLPLVLALYAICFLRDSARINAIIRSVPFWGMTLLYVTFRQTILQGSSPSVTPAFFWQPVLTAFKTVGYYFYLLFFPVRLSLEHPFSPPETFFAPTVVSSTVALLGLLCFIALYFQRSRLLSFGAGWMIITLLPAANLVYLSRSISEQRLYLPSWGACLLLAVAIYSIRRLGNDFFLPGKKVAISVLGVLVAFYCAQTVFRNHDYRDPLVLYAKRAQHAPYSPGAHVGLGDALTVSGNLASARKHYNIARRWRPGYAEAYYGLGLVSAKEGKSTDAVGYFESVLKLEPEHARAYRQMGNLFFQQGRFDEATSAYRHVLRLSPNDADAHYDLAASLAETGQIDAAADHFQAALRLNPDDVDAGYNLGVAMVKKRRFGQAIPWFERVLQQNPDHSKAHLNLGAIYEQQGRRLKAIDHYRQALGATPDATVANYRLGAVLFQEGRLKAAAEHFMAVLQADDENAWACYFLGDIAMKQENYKQAIQYYNRAIALDPELAGVRRNLTAAVKADKQKNRTN